MPSSTTLPAYDWLGAFRRSVEGLRDVFAAHPPGAERLRETGAVGVGGDRTLILDQLAEDLVVEQLRALHQDGARFTLVSEEVGVVDFGDPSLLVVVDPIDGSLNAKRGLTHHALSVAVATGPAMEDVSLAYVYDFGPAEEWRAERGAGAFLNGTPLTGVADERRTGDGRLEIVAVESADPRRLHAASDALRASVHRVRAIGSIAISLCQVAAGRADGMAALRPCRSVDAAAAQLIVRESGGVVEFEGDDGPLGAPLADLQARFTVHAARTAGGLAQVREVRGA